MIILQYYKAVHHDKIVSVPFIIVNASGYIFFDMLKARQMKVPLSKHLFCLETHKINESNLEKQIDRVVPISRDEARGLVDDYINNKNENINKETIL